MQDEIAKYERRSRLLDRFMIGFLIIVLGFVSIAVIAEYL